MYLHALFTLDKNRWLQIPGGEEAGAIMLLVDCGKQQYLPDWELVQQQGIW